MLVLISKFCIIHLINLITYLATGVQMEPLREEDDEYDVLLREKKLKDEKTT